MSVEPLEGYRLKVLFKVGIEGVVSIEPEWRGGVFLKLLAPPVFSAMTINADFGCVEWPGGIEICQEAMQRELRHKPDASLAVAAP
jgi:hypothetical protein